MKKIKKILMLISTCALLACNKDSDVVEIRMGHNMTEQMTVHKAMVYMQNRLDKLSDGKIKLKIYPNSQLGNSNETLTMVQQDIIQMTSISAANLENFAPEMSLFSYPYIFEDSAHYWGFLDGEFGKKILQSASHQNMTGLIFFDAGSRSFYLKQNSVESPADIAGRKIRVMGSYTAKKMIELLGGSPQSIPFGELYSALQQGVVDGAENNPASFYETRHYEVCKYFSLDEHTRVPDLLVVNSKFWATLSKENREIIQQAASEAGLFQRELWAENDKSYMKKLRELGVIITYPDKDAFFQAVKPMLDNVSNDSVNFYLKKIEEIRYLEK
ncbi:MAG: TRAP transporter substrate-binding protein [Spirochaetales bacterium]|nr:TRAP transporter substrate-binding protein [Spirochaetales bacterium]